MCTVCTRVHCIGDHLNALHAFDHLNEYPMASSNTEPISYGNHDADPEEEVDDIFKCRSKAPTVNVDMSDKSLLVKRRRQFYYNHVHSICLQILSKKTATERKSNSTCKPTLLMICSNLWKSLTRFYIWLLCCCKAHPKLLTTALPVLFSILIYFNSIFGDFVHDDLSAIVRNPDVTGVSSISNVFANDFWGTPMSSIHSHKSYRPITILVFRVNYHLCNGQSFCFHGTNILLHGCATFLVSHLCMRILHLDFFTTFVANILFALHPIHTEAVSGLVGCADLLACNFTLMSFLAYNRYLGCPGEPKWHLMSLLAASFAVLSKETGITSLGINILFGASKLFLQMSKSAKKVSKSTKIAVKRISTDAFIMVFLLLCRIQIQDSSLPYFTSQDNPAAFHASILTRTLTFLYLPVLNFWLLLCPHWLSYDWQMGSIPLILSIRDPRFVIIVAFYSIIAILMISIIRSLYSSRHLFASSSNKKVMSSKLQTVIAAMLFMVLPFLPASNLLFPVGFVLAERILYLPSVGYSLLFAVAFQKFVQRVCPSPIQKHPAARLIRKQQALISGRMVALGKQKPHTSTGFEDDKSGTSGCRPMEFSLRPFLAYSLLVILCIAFASKTWTRNQDWISRSSLFRSGLKTVPTNAKVQYNFANVIKEEGKLDLASKHYEEALRLWPNYVLAHNNLATILPDKGKAEWHLRRALNIDPWHSNSLYNLAVLLSNRNLCSVAVGLLERCILEDPSHEHALLLLSDCLLKTRSGKSWLKTMPDTLNLSSMMNIIPTKMPRANKTEESKQHIQMFGDSTHRPFLSFGSSIQEIVFGQDSDDGSKRSKQFDDIVWAKKDSSDRIGQKRTVSLLSHLAEAYIRVANWSKAESLLQKILKSQPTHQVALYQLSQVYLEQNKTSLALTSVRKAKEHCKNIESITTKQSVETSRPCLWGSRCIPRDRICTGILIQEADILREMGYFRMAAKNYRTALDHAPHEPRLLLSLGSIHHALGEWEMAWQHYKRCLQLQPDNKVLIANMKLLEKSSQQHMKK